MGIKKLFLLTTCSAALIVGCGGGGGDGSPAGSSTAPTGTGQLSNSPIDGVSYTGAPSGLAGTTMNGGLYEFTEGDTITFNIAGLEIDVPAGARVTPQVIAEALVPADAMNAVQARQNVLLNLTTFFQTLDNDGDTENGAIEIREGATLGNVEALAANLNAEPAMFQTEFQTALDSSEGVRDEGMDNPDPVNETEAQLRFYRNELQGNWRLVSVQEEGTTINPSGSFDVLISFDAGNSSATGSGPINSFVFAEYDLGDSFSTVGVGTLNFDANSDSFELTSLPRRLRSDGPNDSSTDPDGALFGTTIELSGAQLVLNIDDEGTQIVATFQRFNNQKDSLIGSWYEILPPDSDDGSGISTSVQPTVGEPAANGSVQFGENVASIFYYFLSNSRLMIVTTDLAASGDDDEQNGIVVVDYSVSGTTLSFDAIQLDSVSKNPDVPEFETGPQLEIGEAARNDTMRTLDLGGEIVDIYRVLSLSERVGDFEQSEQISSAQ
ncbi:MAG: hypothetical protein AB1516_09810 [Pseudomonadota bacterium]|uniref:hypothetical protein n=1 Tax=Limnobacter alexandrii TaxID=2570352 RepID=UPI001107AA08|nr:hypothetical protein [Limnobacter alexandrii]